MEVNKKDVSLLNNTSEKLYDILHYYGHDKIIEFNEFIKNFIHTTCLKSKLRQYQVHSINWMIWKEVSNVQNFLLQLDTEKNMFCFNNDSNQDITNLVINYDTGNILGQRPCKREIIHGGILADEMGLGKTVELFALLLVNTKEIFLLTMKALIILLKNNGDTIKETSLIVPPIVSIQISIMTDYLLAMMKNLKNCEKHNLANLISNELNLMDHQDYLSLDEKKCDLNQNHIACICGIMKKGLRKEIRQCIKCYKWQHPKCVNYDAQDHDDISFICCYCAVNTITYQSSATLIITPNSISEQWLSEMDKHLYLQENNIKIMKYNGVHRMSNDFVYPAILAKQDIVVTTYEVLMKEIDHADISYTTMKTLRSPKRFLALPSPLKCIHWWRICLDEAQMIESPLTKVAKMASQLKAFHKWCVTGTPIQKSIDDLYGLVSFLEVQPYNEKKFWEKGIVEPFNQGDGAPFTNLFSRLMWRTRKEDVLDQLGIPPQSVKVYRLTFSPVEEHFYHRQYDESRNLTHKAIEDAMRPKHRRGTLVKLDGTEGEGIDDFQGSQDASVGSLDHESISKLLYPLTKLRLACCHPQIVLMRENAKQKRLGQVAYVAGNRYMRGRRKRINASTEIENPMYKKIMTMEEILETLIKKSTVECEEIHRTFISALNGLAGIDFIRSDYVNAAKRYELIFESYYKYKSHFDTDLLQRIHACFNMQRALNLCEPKEIHSIAPQYSLDFWGERQEYLRRYETELGVKRTALALLEGSLAEPSFVCYDYESLSPYKDYWWIDALTYFECHGLNDDVIAKFVRDELFDVANYKYTSIKTYQYTMLTCLEKICKARKGILTRLQKLSNTPSPKDVEAAVKCHLNYFQAAGKEKSNPSHIAPPNKRPKKSTERCAYCLLEDEFRVYEGLLFRLDNSLDPQISRVDDDNSDVEHDEFLSQEEDTAAANRIRDGGVWKESHIEKALKIVYASVRHAVSPSDAQMKERGREHLKWLEMVKREYKASHEYLSALQNRVSALDELNMSITRLQLKDPTPKDFVGEGSSFSEDEVPKALNLISPHEIEEQTVVLTHQMEQGVIDISKKLGQFYYLNNLQKRQSTVHQAEETCGGSNSDAEKSKTTNTCPICLKPLSSEWNVLLCGHFFCFTCVEQVMKRSLLHSTERGMKCPLCRQVTPKSELSWVTTEKSRLTDDMGLGNISLKGSHSTKICGIIATLLHINHTDRGAKCLVFSNWPSILRILGIGLTENGINHTHIFVKGKPEDLQGINELQCPPPSLSFGAAGLNITEATHVLFVEPILNRAIEQQALGRVHRMGQTKKTYVYKFVVRGTIEEKIVDVSSALPTPSGYKTKECLNLTLNQLSSLYSHH